ncbi:hypothetical protein NGA_2032400, partial [Nannochloropsis gaditana CCMP526]|uniref:uncharacterized protein n=1 Tax=Nannochloropsis gaditana (strain CCMP526) TaxID=1093141 RepID=UPI00029F58F4
GPNDAPPPLPPPPCPGKKNEPGKRLASGAGETFTTSCVNSRQARYSSEVMISSTNPRALASRPCQTSPVPTASTSTIFRHRPMWALKASWTFARSSRSLPS